MKSSSQYSLVFLILNSSFLIGFAPSTCAQIQQAWVARYDNGVTNGQNQAVKIALDSNGNVYMCGYSESANSNLDYALLKYAPNGYQTWASRFDSTNVTQAKPAGFAVDPGNNVIITGNAGTVRWDSAGNEKWVLPYNGLAVVSDSSSNVLVTGFGTNFDTVKLTPGGSNLWLQRYTDVGPTVGEAICVDNNGAAYISGSDIFQYYRVAPPDSYAPVANLLTLKLAADGSSIWSEQFNQGEWLPTTVLVKGLALDNLGNAYVISDFFSGNNPVRTFQTIKYTSESGASSWVASNPTGNNSSQGHGLTLDSSSNVLVTGQNDYHSTPNCAYATYKISTSGAYLWTNSFPYLPTATEPSTTVNVATAITVAQRDSIYVTGYSPGANTGDDIVTIAYDTNGKQLWLQRYDGPAHGDDEGNAIAVDANGNVYVAGYETVPGGGTEMVLIKYAPGPFIKKQANGSFLLQAEGSANEPFDIQATTNLETWSDLAQTNADPTGLLQYLDTNAPSYPSRFYLAIPQ